MSLQIEDDSVWNPYAKYEETIESLRRQLASITEERDQWKNNAINGGNAAYLRQQLAEKDAEISSMWVQLCEANGAAATIQAVNQQLREALTGCVCAMQDYQAGIGITEMFDKSERLGRLALQSEKQDNAALSAMITKAGEVMRNNCVEWVRKNIRHRDGQAYISIEIRALPGVTLEDIK